MGILGLEVLLAQRIRSISLSTIILFIIVFFGIMLILDDYVFLVLQFLRNFKWGITAISKSRYIYKHYLISGVTAP